MCVLSHLAHSFSSVKFKHTHNIFNGSEKCHVLVIAQFLVAMQKQIDNITVLILTQNAQFI